MSKYTVRRDIEELDIKDLLEILVTELSRRISNDKAELEILEPFYFELEKVTKQ